jgi:hypothetical protein
MPHNQVCPCCLIKIEDWHVEWCKSEVPALYKGLAALDCPLCGEPTSLVGLVVGTAPLSVPLVRRDVHKAAEWAVDQAAGGSLEWYTSNAGPGIQYANYWSLAEIQRADQDERAKKVP